MRHRITDLHTGLGNPEPVKMDNNIQLEKSEFWDNFLEDAIKTFSVIRDYNGFDYRIDENQFIFGIEPAYEGDDLQIIKFNFEDKNSSYIRQGHSFGAYGSNIVSKYRFYGDYKRKSKFVNFIDKWWGVLQLEIRKILEVTNEKHIN